AFFAGTGLRRRRSRSRRADSLHAVGPRVQLPGNRLDLVTALRDHVVGIGEGIPRRVLHLWADGLERELVGLLARDVVQRLDLRDRDQLVVHSVLVAGRGIVTAG